MLTSLYDTERAGGGAASRDSPGGRQSQAATQFFWAVLIASSSETMPPMGEVKNFLRLVFLFLSAPPFPVCQKAVEEVIRFFGKYPRYAIPSLPPSTSCPIHVVLL